MEKKDILTSDFLDLLFEGRNKAYGAYDLRRTYNKRITVALGGTTLICLLFIAGSIWAHAKKKENRMLLVEATVELKNIKQDEPKPEEIKPLKPELPKVATTQYVVPKITPDDQVKPEEEMKEMAVLEDTKIGNMNVDGAKDEGMVAPLVEAKGTGIISAPKNKGDENETGFISVEIPASFKGGIEAWRKYLERNLNRDLPTENGAPAGDYPVIVSFMVDKDGKISDVRAENDPGYGTKDEAVRVIKKGPDWVPAQQNGKYVTYRHRQSIVFKVTNE